MLHIPNLGFSRNRFALGVPTDSCSDSVVAVDWEGLVLSFDAGLGKVGRAVRIDASGGRDNNLTSDQN